METKVWAWWAHVIENPQDENMGPMVGVSKQELTG